MNTGRDIWKEGYRVFLSHESNAKVEAPGFKSSLELYGITAFLAHEDISPTRLWEEDIKNALASMNAFVPLLTESFHGSNWTDQEIGYALCRNVPIIPVRLGLDPYGFIGKLQAVALSWDEAPLEVVRVLIADDPRMVDAYVDAVVRCNNFYHGNQLAKILESIAALTDGQVSILMKAFNENDQVNKSYGFSGRGSYKHGTGLKGHLERIKGKEFYFRDQDGQSILDDLPF